LAKNTNTLALINFALSQGYKAIYNFYITSQQGEILRFFQWKILIFSAGNADEDEGID